MSDTYIDDHDDPQHNDSDDGQLGGTPSAERVLGVSIFNRANDNQPKAHDMSVPALESTIKAAVDKALVEVDATEEAKKKGMALSPCRYKPGTTRGNVNVDVVTAFVMDLDNVDDDFVDEVFANLASMGVRAFGWSTWGSGWKKLPQSWRVVVPFAVDVDAADWPAVWLLLSESVALGRNDVTTKDPARMHFLPRAPRMVPDGEEGKRRNEPVRWRSLHGALFDPSSVVEESRLTLALAPKPTSGSRLVDVYQPPSLDLGLDPLGLDFDPVPRMKPKPSNRPDRVERARQYANKADPAVSGERGSDTAMGVVGRVVRGFDLTESEAIDALKEWNKRCKPPWSPAELARKVSEVKDTDDPENRTDGWLLNQDRPMPSTTNHKADRRASGGVGEGEAANDDVDPVAASWQADMAKAREDLEMVMGTSSAALATPCDFVSYADLMGKNIPPMSWLIGGLITDGAIAVVSGEPKTAKTWLAIELAVSVALGDKALGEFQAHGPRPVALFLTEDHEANVRARLRGTVIGHAGAHADGEIPAYIAARKSLNLADIDTVAWLVASVRKLPSPPALLVIDPLRNVMGKLKESDNDDMAEVNKALRAVRDVLGSVILYVHHAGKLTEQNASRRPGQKMRGGGALHGGYDAGIHLSAPTISIDGATVMGASVDVEVKAGKSAAPFSFALNIHDDDNGQCVRADWAFDGKTKAAKGAENVADKGEAAILAVWRNTRMDMRMTKSAVVLAAGGRKRDRLALVDAMITDDRLASDGKSVWPVDCVARYGNGFQGTFERAWWASGTEDLDGQPFITTAGLRLALVQSGQAPGEVDAYLAKKEKAHRRGELLGELVALGVIKAHAALVTTTEPEDEQPGWIVVDPTVGADLIKRRDAGQADGAGGPVGGGVDVGAGPTAEVPGSREVPEVPGTAHKGQVPGSLPHRGTGLGNLLEPTESGELGRQPVLPHVGKKPTPKVEWGG